MLSVCLSSKLRQEWSAWSQSLSVDGAGAGVFRALLVVVIDVTWVETVVEEDWTVVLALCSFAGAVVVVALNVVGVLDDTSSRATVVVSAGDSTSGKWVSTVSSAEFSGSGSDTEIFANESSGASEPAVSLVELSAADSLDDSAVDV